MIRRDILLGSNNAKKRKELSAILEEMPLHVLIPSEVGQYPSPEENGDTFEENASIKALYFSERTGLPTLADDSGLVVDALDGEPGVRSSRYAGEDATDLDNCKKLLSVLENVPYPERTARFVCVVVVALEGRVLGSARGTCEGTLLTRMRGTRGFGYDPLFLYEPEGLTFAELPSSIKNRVSHRAKALRGIVPVLRAL